MTVPTVMDLQGFVIGKKFIVKEVAVLRKAILSHYIFTCPMPWSFFTKLEKYCASWLSAYHYGFQWEDGMNPYSMVKHLITIVVIGVEDSDDNKALVCVKGREKREWLTDVLDSDNLTIETLDADYKDIDSLHNLDVTNTMMCKRLKRFHDNYLCKKSIENSRAKKRPLKEQNLGNYCVKKQFLYAQDVENKQRYKNNKEKNRVNRRTRYLKHSQHERDRQTQYHNRKWLYNKRYYEKKNIIKKYDKLWSKSYIQMRNPIIITDIVKKINIKDHVKKQLEAEKIVRWSLHVRNSYIRNMYKILAILKKRSEVHLTLVTDCLTIDDRLHALCGISRHTASTENYFASMYHDKLVSSEPLIMNVKGQVTNILPLIEARAKQA
ncbi:hypothetical protein ALC57_11765 [Trachymyrmex cornetzi]|uniref:Uncharacterized protein n=1 Tax=Trachymyrmex cornetzi TaxID=471704 RepID=A0A151J217_9HYME|nr:hypothetical protein ALC57_11765 [Trachymyrmex cornetzi]